MRIAVSSDELTGVAGILVQELQSRGHEVIAHGALRNAVAAAQEQLAPGEREDDRAASDAAGSEEWAWASEAAARALADGAAERAIVCCWTGTGASIAANKVAGVRAALCHDRVSAEGARRWNDANALAISLRSTSEQLLREILDGFLLTPPSTEAEDRANIAHIEEIERAGR